MNGFSFQMARNSGGRSEFDMLGKIYSDESYKVLIQEERLSLIADDV